MNELDASKYTSHASLVQPERVASARHMCGYGRKQPQLRTSYLGHCETTDSKGPVASTPNSSAKKDSRTLEYIHRELIWPKRETPVMQLAVSMCNVTLSWNSRPGLWPDAACSCNQANASPPAYHSQHVSFTPGLAATSRIPVLLNIGFPHTT